MGEEEIASKFFGFDLNQMRPKVIPYNAAYQVIPTLDKLPEPKDASPTLPEVVAFSYEIPGVEPTLSFMEFIRGVACATLMVPSQHHEAIKGILVTVAERVVNTGELPSLSDTYQVNLSQQVKIIFNNNEPSSWRGLLAFMQGAYWLLGFIKNPRDQRGKGGLSPETYVDLMVTHFAQLGYVPR